MATNNIVITPENILYIHIQYVLPQSGYQPVIPAIVVYYNDGNVRQAQITLAELQFYIKYLQIKAAAEGKEVTATQDGNTKTIIGVGIEGAGNPQAVQLAVAGNNPCAAIPTIVYLDHAAPFVTGDILYSDVNLTTPIVGFDLVANMDDGIIYDLDNATGEVGLDTGDTCTIPPPVIAPFDVTFQLDGVNFDAPKLLTDANGSCTTLNAFTIRSTVNQFWVATFILPQRGYGSFTEDYNIPFLPVNTYVTAIASAGNVNWNCVITFAAAAVNTNINFTTKTAAQQSVAKVRTAIDFPAFQGYAAIYPFTGAGGANGMKGTTAEKTAQDDGVIQVCGKPDTIGDPLNGFFASILAFDPPYPTYITRVAFYLNNVIVQTVEILTDILNLPATGYIDQTTNGVPDQDDYDEIRIDLLTTPPPMGKNVWFINQSGQPLIITTDVATYNFAVGENKNIQIVASGLFRNDSVTAETFEFLQSMPALQDPNTIAPNPDIIAGAGGTKAMAADLSLLNYIRCT